MKKKSIISALLASCLAVSAIGTIIASADDLVTYGFDAYTSGSYIGGQKHYRATGVADGRRKLVISGYMFDKQGRPSYPAYGNARQKTTNWISSVNTNGNGRFLYYDCQQDLQLIRYCYHS